MADLSLPVEPHAPPVLSVAARRFGNWVRAVTVLGLAFLRGPRRPALLGFGALTCYVAAGLTINLTVGLVLAGVGLTVLDWRFSGQSDSRSDEGGGG